MSKRKNTCHGDCFTQSDDDLNKYIKNRKCKFNCELHACTCCGELNPEWFLDCYHGFCIRCDMNRFKNTRKKGSGYCKLCQKILVPIGTSRGNGNQLHDDWKGREYHKKCWLELKRREENDSETDDSGDIDYTVKENIPKWVGNVPKLINRVGSEEMWKQTHSCVHCGREKYNPLFYFGYRRLCVICLANNTNKLKKKYENNQLCDNMNIDDIELLSE